MSGSGYDNIATYDSSRDSANYTQLAGLISDGLRDIIEATFQVVICGIMSVLGFVANVINIIVFCKQGFSDTISISLLGMAIADLGSLFFFVLVSILRIPLFEGSRIFLGTGDIYYRVAIILGWPHICFAVISSWIQVFITFERCLCIAQPLQVKTIITKKRAIFVNATIFGAMVTFMLPPLFYALRIGPRNAQTYNRTLIVMFQIENGMDIENAVIQIIIIFSQTGTFCIVIIFTVVLTRSLVLKTKWRRETANISGSDFRDAMSSRDKSVVKLVISISSIFIFSYLPSVVNAALIVYFSPHYSVNGRYKNMYIAAWGLLNVFECINGSINIIIYYKMSSKYRAVLTSMFCPSYKHTTR